MPINHVDKASCKHDKCYKKNPDTKTRNDVCDKNMLKDLKGIYKPTNGKKWNAASFPL